MSNHFNSPSVRIMAMAMESGGSSVAAMDYPVIAESNNRGSISINSCGSGGSNNNKSNSHINNSNNNSKGTSSGKGSKSGNRSSWSQVVRGGDIPKPHHRAPNHELSGKPAAKPSDGSSAMATQAGNTATVMGAEARNDSKPLDPPRHTQTAETIAVTQVCTTLNRGGGNNTPNPTASLNRQKSGGRCAAAANGMPQAKPTPSFYLVAGVPPPLPVHDYIMPGGPKHLIPEGYPDPMFKGPGGMEAGFKGLMLGSGNTDHFRNS